MLNRILNIFFPPACPVCRQYTYDPGTLCSECWNKINFITPPFCDKCSNPIDNGSDHTAICANCLSKPPPYNKTRALLYYDEFSKPIITQLKYYDKTYIAKYSANWLYSRYKDIIDSVDILTSVPLHKKRLSKRRYNQSALIAKHLSKESKSVQFIPDALIRKKNSIPQTQLTFKQRIVNLNNSFALNTKRNIVGKKICIIDDVITTGTTIYQCSKLLVEGGAKEVNVIALAKNCKK